MIEVVFNYKELKTIIQCKLNDKIKNICQNYLNGINEDKNKIYFSYNGNVGNNFNNILVIKNEMKKEEKDIIKSKDVICPECGESIRFEIINYKIKLFECKNGHKINNILLNEFEKTQYINNKEIKYEKNNNNKSN